MKDFLGQWMPPDYSKHGAALDDLSAAVHWVMLILFVLWGASGSLIRFLPNLI